MAGLLTKKEVTGLELVTSFFIFLIVKRAC
jgi:hypothetical protein